MAKRMLNTDIWKSKQVSNLSIQARLLYVGLITFGDDDGRLNGDPALLRSQIFPRDEKVTVAEVTKWLEEIVASGLVVKYTANGDDYLAHPNWTRYQTIRADRQKESNIPPPPADLVTAELQPSVNQVSAKDKIREGKITKEKVTSLFEAFWKEYPNKTAKKKAQQSWERIFTVNKPDELYTAIMAGLERSKKSSQWVKDGGQFVPHPTTWLNQERWNDEGRTTGATKTHKI